MTYFNKFPEIDYRFSGCTSQTNLVKFTDLTAFSDVIANIADDAALYSNYTVKDGERPDVVSERIYGTTDHYWTFYILNEHLRTQGWPLSQYDLKRKMNEDLPGECLVFLPQDAIFLGPDTDYKQHPLINNFNIGDTVYGQISGATGVVYNRNVNLGQLFVRKTNNIPFQENEVVVDAISGSPNSQLTTRIVHNPAWDAVHHFEDGDGDHVDVDYALEFRGRGSELNPENVSGLPDGAGPGPDGNYIGGVVGSPQFPDAYATDNPYTTITYREFYTDVNDHLSRIKVLKPGIVGEFAKLHKKSL